MRRWLTWVSLGVLVVLVVIAVLVRVLDGTTLPDLPRWANLLVVVALAVNLTRRVRRSRRAGVPVGERHALTAKEAVTVGGWDPRYAVVRALASHDDIAAAVVDPNGDGGSIDLDEYHRGPDGGWVAGNSGGSAGESGLSWSPEMVAAYGRTTPGGQVQVDYRRTTSTVTADDDGWWLLVTRSRDEDSMPSVRPVIGPVVGQG